MCRSKATIRDLSGIIFYVLGQRFHARRRCDGTRSVTQWNSNAAINCRPGPTAIGVLAREDGANSAIECFAPIPQVQKSYDAGRRLEIVTPTAIRFLQ